MTLVVVCFLHLGIGCYLLTKNELISPDRRWTAVSDVQECPNPLTTFVPAGVEIVSNTNPRHRARILDVDIGSEDERPRVSWTASNVLRITVPNRSDLYVVRRNYQGVWIDLRFDPDDRAARDTWLKENNMQPDPLEK